MRLLAKARLHAGGKGNRVLTEFFAQTIGGGERLVPLLVRALSVEADLLALVFEVRNMNSQQPDRIALPVRAEQLPDGGEYLGIDRRRPVSGSTRSSLDQSARSPVGPRKPIRPYRPAGVSLYTVPNW